MTLHVLGGVEEHTQHRRRQSLHTNSARLRQRLNGRNLQLRQRSLHSIRQGFEQHARSDRRIRRTALGRKCRPLLIRQLLSPRVCEQPVNHTGDVLQMETNRRNPRGPCPKQVVRKFDQRRAHVIASLDQRMRNGLQWNRNAVDKSTKPGLHRHHTRQTTMASGKMHAVSGVRRTISSRVKTDIPRSVGDCRPGTKTADSDCRLTTRLSTDDSLTGDSEGYHPATGPLTAPDRMARRTSSIVASPPGAAPPHSNRVASGAQ